MHLPNILLSLLSLTATTATTITAHLLPPQPPHPGLLPRSNPQNTCTFTLYHKQLAPSKTNYIFLPSLTSASNLVFNIAASKPANAHNSYSRLSATQQFSVRGLPGSDTLTISGRDGEDELEFETEEVRWVVGGEVDEDDGREEKGCTGGEWVESGVNRERKLECHFPCRSMDSEEDTERMELR